MKHKAITILAGIVLFSMILSAVDFGVIKNPKPNMKETRYVPLEKTKTVDADLGNGEYLFKPTSIAVAKDGVFVYDILQAKIFKFNPTLETVITSFGRKGQGPGEFGGTGKAYSVYLQVGIDNKLYANDTQMRKTIVFDNNGKYIGEFKNRTYDFKEPWIDASGNLISISVEDKMLNVMNQDKKVLFTMPHNERWFDYLVARPGTDYLKSTVKNLGWELLRMIAPDSTLLLYSLSSSRLIMLKNNKIVKEINIWPADALAAYPGKLDRLLKKNKNWYIPMFSKLFIDEGNPGMFYLQFGENGLKGINALYQFHQDCKLAQVFFVKIEESVPFTRFEAKGKDRFYAIESDKLITYQEEK